MSEYLHNEKLTLEEVRPLPSGWQATLSTERDDYETPYGIDAFGKAEIDAWKADQWMFATITVTVTDNLGRLWGSESLSGCVDDFEREDGGVTYAHEHEEIPAMAARAVSEAGKNVREFLATVQPW